MASCRTGARPGLPLRAASAAAALYIVTLFTVILPELEELSQGSRHYGPRARTLMERPPARVPPPQARAPKERAPAHFAPPPSAPRPPRRLVDTANPIYFLHVGKAGGTSVDVLFKNNHIKAVLKNKHKKYIGNEHYDWSYVQLLEQQRHRPQNQNQPQLTQGQQQVATNGKPQRLPQTQNQRQRTHGQQLITANGKSRKRRPQTRNQGQHTKEQQEIVTHGKPRHLRLSSEDHAEDLDVSDTADVVMLLRNPVSRAFSQFSFSKGLPWAKRQKQKFLKQTFEEYLADPNKTWTQPIRDGESGVDFLAGIFTTEGSWVSTDGEETAFKRYLRTNQTAACLVAARRLERTPWFGLLEETGRSMTLLRLSLGLKENFVLPHSNGQKSRRQQMSPELERRVAAYMPMDMWLYEYGRRLFEARWAYFAGNASAYSPPELPPLPEF